MAASSSSVFSDPAVVASLIQGGAGLLGGLGQGISQGNQLSQNKKLAKAQMIDQALRDQQTDDYGRAVQGLASTQMDPYAASKFLEKQNLARQALGGMSQAGFTFDPASGMGKMTGGVTIPKGGFDVSALAPRALAASAGDFYNNRAMVQPNVPAPNLRAEGLGRAGAQATGNVEDFRTTVAQPQLNDLRQKRVDQINTALKDDEDEGGGFWKTLGKIGLLAGGGIATALTAGAASPLLAAAIGAGTGAASGAIDNGWKGALTGAALGGVTGGFASGAGGVAGSAVKQSLGGAIKSTLTDPRSLARIVGGGIGGPVGNTVALASSIGRSPFKLPVKRPPTMPSPYEDN